METLLDRTLNDIAKKGEKLMDLYSRKKKYVWTEKNEYKVNFSFSSVAFACVWWGQLGFLKKKTIKIVL